MQRLTFAFCTFNRADRLDKLVGAMREQACPVSFEILAVNNNSSDATPEVLARLANQPGPPLRWVTETTQGIVPARNRAIREAIDSSILVFIDDDELPQPGLLNAVTDAILNEGADCVGGPIAIDFAPFAPPSWLDNELSGFLGALYHGPSPFWITSDHAPIWSGNVAYRMQLFRENSVLRFDLRYNREGIGIGGGSDAIMFRTLLALDFKIRYRPDMAITHSVDRWKLTRRYFLKLHYRAGLRRGRYQLPDYPRTVFGIPPFLASHFLRQAADALWMQVAQRPGALRQAMNATNALGCLVGYGQRGKP
ncbi:glycosyltransferase family 2 protein [Aromatoleum anaerobium]|uniref:Glycosyltransferase n=1 Tax=Aromatoleum anaerobium TaxID=182180 RepID=A0ABX1PG22_9RHOO|nr:glycosyltransferase [Aromatoleum anaerobium]MCK0509205.1 glycosyltransferase family 2 protein [Aromatoleum anaerobium]